MIAAGLHQGNLGVMPYAVDQCDNCRMGFVRLVPWQRFCCTSCRQDYNYYANREKRIAYQKQYRAENKSVKRNKPSLTDLADFIASEIDSLKAHYEKMMSEQVYRYEQKIDALESKIENMETVAPRQSDAPTLRNAPPPKAHDDMPELEIKAAVVDGGKSSANFMKSLIAIQTSAKPHAPMVIPEAKKVVESGNARTIAGAGTALSVPDFDDMEL